MRKTTLILVLALLLVLPTFAGHVSSEKAHGLAVHFMSVNGVKADQLRDVSAEAGFPNLHVFAADHAFVVLSADDLAIPVLGYSFNNAFDAESIPEHVRWWLSTYNDQIQFMIDNGLGGTPEVTLQWDDLERGEVAPSGQKTVVGPLISTTWNQSYPYNYYCPSASGGSGGHVYTGCVATAMAQIIKYYNAPVHGIGSHTYTHNLYGQQTANFYETTYDWSNMPTYINNYSGQTQINAVATLMYHCGVSVEMNYGVNGSGASPSNVSPALINYFNFSQSANLVIRENYSDSDWIALIRSELNASRPVLYNGFSSDYSSGHSFVCDGYDSNTYGSYYFRFNWGWSGNYDGYFSIDAMTPGGNGAGGGSHNYSYGQNAVIGIKPSTNNAIPSNLNYSVDGGNVTLTWTGSGGASGYKIFKDSNCIDTSTTNSYVVNNAYGTHIYYVRSVDSSGEMSLSSNTVTVTVGYSTPVVNDLQGSVNGNNVSLSWSAPEWCYPQTPTATLNYGVGDLYYSWTSVYYGHKYPASDLGQYANKRVYKVETFVHYPGTYTVYVYTGSSGSQPDPSSLAVTLSRDIPGTGWQEFIFDQPITLSGNSDLWVVMKQENTGMAYPTPSFNLDTYNANACFSGSSSPTAIYSVTGYSVSWFIQTFLTDGAYTYNLYRNGSSIATNLAGTSYNDNNLPTGIYNYYLKTNYYAGETGPSNTVSLQVGTINYYDITVSADPSSGGSVTGGGTFMEGNQCTVSATANTGYTFVNWTKNGVQVSTSASYTFTVTETAQYVAHFALNSYTITVSADPTTGGTVTGGGTYNHGVNCTITATANTGYTFVNWTKNGVQVSTNASYTFTVTETAQYVAHFALNSYTISVSADPTTGGTVTGGGTYNHGVNCTIIATANTGYTFENWTKNGAQVSTNSSYTFTVTETAEYVAHFSLNSYTITVSADPAEGGTVDGGGTYDYGTTCTLTATPLANYNFVNWTKNGNPVSISPSYTFTVTEAGDYVAHFSEEVYYTVVVTADPSAGGTVTGGGTFTEGESCTIIATANTGYTFVNWTKNGTQVSSNTTYTFTVTETAEYVAHFSLNSYDIIVAADPAEGGTVDGGGTYDYGTICTLVATPTEGWVFVNWTENGNVLSEDETYTFTVTSDRSLKAHFYDEVGIGEQDDLGVKVYPNPVSDLLIVESKTPLCQCEIYTMTGECVLVLKDCSNRVEIPVQQLSSGKYVIRLVSENAVQIKKFIKD